MRVFGSYYREGIMNKILLSLCLGLSFSTFSKVRQINLEGTNEVKYVNLHLVVGKNAAYLNDSYDGQVATWLTRILTTYKNKNAPNLYLILDSPGGSITDGLGAISAMKLVSERYGTKTTCVINDLAASMAAVHSAFCDLTVMNQYGALMHHHPSYGIGRAARNILQERFRFSEVWLDLVEGKIAAQYGLSTTEWQGFIKAERWFTAEDAARHGLVDKVVENLIIESIYEKED